VRLYSVRFVCAIPTALRANPCGDTILTWGIFFWSGMNLWL
jgi:hypothetical protein